MGDGTTKLVPTDPTSIMLIEFRIMYIMLMVSMTNVEVSVNS